MVSFCHKTRNAWRHVTALYCHKPSGPCALRYIFRNSIIALRNSSVSKFPREVDLAIKCFITLTAASAVPLALCDEEPGLFLTCVKPQSSQNWESSCEANWGPPSERNWAGNTVLPKRRNDWPPGVFVHDEEKIVALHTDQVSCNTFKRTTTGGLGWEASRSAQCSHCSINDHMQMAPPFCFGRGRHLERSFAGQAAYSIQVRLHCCVSEFWSHCEVLHELGDSERWREWWMSVRTSCLPPEAESG